MGHRSRIINSDDVLYITGRKLGRGPLQYPINSRGSPSRNPLGKMVLRDLRSLGSALNMNRF